MKLKCIKKCCCFTESNYYNVRKYNCDNCYIVLDDDGEEHYISYNFAIDHFMEV